jgi:hypothetical protein
MARSFEEILNSLPQERQQIINQGIEQLVAEEMALHKLNQFEDLQDNNNPDITTEVSESQTESIPF